MRERILLALLIPCAGIIVAALLSTTPVPTTLQPFTEERAQEAQKKFPDGTFISTTTYRFCSSKTFWYAYSDGTLRGPYGPCWR